MKKIMYRSYVGYRFRPLIRGFFFYKDGILRFGIFMVCCFRPLIRGFFFYLEKLLKKDGWKLKRFPSPHSGILFLLTLERVLIV